MDAALVAMIWQRAGNCREYCQMSQACDELPFEIDHIIAKQHDGPTTPGNLALVCFADNHHKGPNLGGVDPKTRKRVWLFHPRRHKWDRHFRWNGPILIGRTAVGRATIAVLAMNLPHRARHRRQLIAEGVFPPSVST
ncbi:MAG TPA: HNH endonuclease signature motif containing protein [Gemmataceae bacterium]|jgi:hypothetical protein|nr:HNH endonuclease signature motif containing protein [Gemmataceae bacterium]